MGLVDSCITNADIQGSQIERFLDEWHSPSDRILVHTSGSTGSPKPIWVEKCRMEASARMTCSFLGLKRGDTALLCLPLDYIAGKMVVVRALTWGMHIMSVEPCGHPLAHVGSVPDFAAMVPMQVWNSLQVPEEREKLQAIRQLIIGGGAVSDSLCTELRRFPHAVWSTYGMTETLSHVALRRLSGHDASDWYTPFECVSLALNDEGCLVIDAPAVCEERLQTRDRAELLADGRFRILGRLDNVICSGGLKIQAEEVEQLLSAHLSAPFLITKRADEKFGEAVVLLTEGNTDEAREVCRRVLPPHWCPRSYVHVERLPMTETGKVKRMPFFSFKSDQIS